MRSWRDRGRRSGRTGHIGGRGGVIETVSVISFELQTLG